ncbi:LSM domain-containing protein [Phytophthora infestans]|uniref:LSM domain-containing protein n=1 Tax=Phytophthora infestans TaxID=4787 RepID=A0A833W2S6_PHYIN|nr:LSM domain-containing protein [Phytophthora infestans]KAF4132025.1 LSM domain-containing protein [Phytophthora infestans]
MDAALVEERLRAFYAKHNPGNDQNIAQIVRKFAGRERQLCAKLFKKYGEAPDFTSAGDTAKEKDITKAAGPVSYPNAMYDRGFEAYLLPKATDSPLDFRSAQFDALKALQTPKQQLKLPVVAAYPLDNTQKCRHLLPESDVNRQTLVARLKKANPSAAEAKAVAVKKVPAPATPSLFEQLAETYLDGPFRVLRHCFLERMRVFVVIRRVNSVRGTCSGFLKAFDKHMNLVLLDVTQDFIPLSTHERLLRQVREDKRPVSDAVFSAADQRRNRRVFASAGGTRREYVKQLFIRGDNVVSVSAAVGNTTGHRPQQTSRQDKQRSSRS